MTLLIWACVPGRARRTVRAEQISTNAEISAKPCSFAGRPQIGGIGLLLPGLGDDVVDRDRLLR
jgi:hypothetical protein